MSMEAVENAFKTIDKYYDVHAITTREDWSNAFPSAKESMENAEKSTSSMASSKVFELDVNGYRQRVHTLLAYASALDRIITTCIKDGTYKTDLLHHKVESETGILYDTRVREVHRIANWANNEFLRLITPPRQW